MMIGLRKLVLAVLGCAAILACAEGPSPEVLPPAKHAWEGDSWQSKDWGFQGKVVVGPNDIAKRPETVDASIKPRYTEAARRDHVNGIVKVELRLDAQGRITDIAVTSPLEPGLDANVVEAVRQWIFKPARLNGSPLPSVMSVTANFQVQ